MKKLMMVLMIATMTMLLVNSAFAQPATQTQTLTLSVGTVYKMIVSGNPAAMNITTGTAGTDALTSVTDASTTYSITQNYGPTVKITAQLDAALAAGYSLTVTLASGKGTSIPNVPLNATAANVVTGIGMGADAAKQISYTFAANASAGTMASGSHTVTYTLTN